jgi:hypothetical protein
MKNCNRMQNHRQMKVRRARITRRIEKRRKTDPAFLFHGSKRDIKQPLREDDKVLDLSEEV